VIVTACTYVPHLVAVFVLSPVAVPSAAVVVVVVVVEPFGNNTELDQC